MKAVFYEGLGRFALGDSEPRSPADGEVRLEVAYCGICGTDLHIAHGAMDHRVSTPQVIGHEMSGTVAELGAGVDGFEIGDPVVVRPLDAQGETPADKGFSHISRNLKFLGIDTPGAFQGSWTVPAFTLHRLPSGVDLKIAALTEPLAVACHDVRRAELRPDETAVVIGGGPIGSARRTRRPGDGRERPGERGQSQPGGSRGENSASMSSTRALSMWRST